MAHQLIYTSVPSGLVAGRSGFCTAARHKEIKEGLVSRIENISAAFDRESRVGGSGGALPVIFSHRIVDVRGTKSHLLMRVADAGSDYTGRTNHIAHSFVLDPSEVSRLDISPAEAILHLTKESLWETRYEGAAKYLGPESEIDFGKVSHQVHLPASRWESVTGAAANAAWLVDTKATMGAGIVASSRDENDELLHLFAESLLIVGSSRKNPHAMWERPFTTHLQPSDNRSDFDWYGCPHNSPAHMQAVKANRFIIEIAPGMTPPEGPKALIAEGQTVATDEAEVTASIPLSPQNPEVIGSPDQTGAPRGQATINAPAPASILPQNASLSGTSKPKKGGIPTGLKIGIGFAVVALLCIGLLVFSLFGGGERKKLENRISEAVNSGNWSLAGEILQREISANQREIYREESGDFKKLEKVVDLAARYEAVASDPERIALENKDKVGTLGNYVTMIEKDAAAAGVQPGSELALSSLRQDAQRAAKEYDTTISSLSELWNLIKLGTPWVEKWQKFQKKFQSFSLPPEGPAMRQIKDLEEISEIASQFDQLEARTHTKEETSKEAQNAAKALADKLYTKVDKSDKGIWRDAIDGLYGKIGRFKPTIKVDLPPPPPKEDPDKMAQKAADEKRKADEAAGDLPPIPPTYFWRTHPSQVYSYGGIPELEGEFSNSFALLAADLLPPGDLQFLENRLEDKIYFDNASSKHVMELDDEGKKLKGIGKFEDKFGNGFYFGFGAKESQKPDFQIFAQRPNEYASRESAKDLPYFMSLPVSELVKPSEGVVAAQLAPKATALLNQIKIGPEVLDYELVLELKDGKTTLRGEAKEVTALNIPVIAETERQIAAIATQIKNLQDAKLNKGKFEGIFSDAGKKLLLDKKGEIREVGLRYRLENKDKNTFRILPNPDEAESINIEDIIQTLEDYKSQRTIEGDPFIHFINSYIFEKLANRAFKSHRWATIQGPINQQTKRIVSKRTSAYASEAEYAAAIIKGWKEVSKMSKEQAWAKIPPVDKPVVGGKDETESRIRRIQSAYSDDRYLSEFFKRWDDLFTPDNVAVLEAYLTVGTALPNDIDARITTLKANSDTLEAQKKEWQEKPLKDWGTFYINAIVKGEPTASNPGKKEVFRLFKSQ